MNSHKKIPHYLVILSYLATFISSTNALGQSETGSFSDYGALIFDQIQTSSVVSSASRDTWKIMQDRQGFLWFSSVGGLHRYDGYSFKNYYNNIEDSTSIPPHRVWEIEEDHTGNIWVATSGGLRIFNPQKERFYKLQCNDSTYLSSEITYNIIRDKLDRMWVTTRGHGFFIFDLQQDTALHFQHDANNPNSLSNDIVVEIIEDQQGRFWIATMWGGLNRLDSLGGPFFHYYHDPNNENSIPSNSIMYVLEDSEGKIWLTTWNGVCTIDPISESITRYKHHPDDPGTLVHNRTWHVTEDSNNRIWIATSGGLSIFDKEKQRFFNYTLDPFNENGISDNYIRFSFEDQDSNMWLTSANGINKVDRFSNQFSFSPFRRVPGIKEENPHDGISVILEDKKGQVWVGTNGGGIYLQGQEDKTTRLFKNVGNALTTSVWYLFEDSLGRILAATHAGVLVFNEISAQFDPLYIGTSSQELKHSIRRMIEPTAGEIWMVGDDGLFILRSDLDSLIHKKGTLDVLTTIYQDSKGRVWLGSEKGLQVIHSDDTISSFFHESANLNSLSHNAITAIREDQIGHIWITTNQGLNQLTFSASSKNPTIKRWSSSNTELPTNELKDITLDENNQIWLLTPWEIVRFHPESGACEPFSPLPPSDILTSKFSITQQGKFYVGGYWGIYGFYPNQLQEITIAPRVAITDFKLFNKSVHIRESFADTLPWDSPLTKAARFTESIKLKHWQNDFSFEFAALNFSQSFKNTFQYRLEGYDKDWISPATNYPIASYTNIPAGNYTFRVIASNKNGVFSEGGITISLNISPPWYWAWWSKTFYLLVVVGIIYAVYRFQLYRKLEQAEAHRLKELNAVKTQLYTNITHEFRTPLTIILGMADQLKNQASEHVKDGLQLIKRNGRQLLRLVNQMLDLSKLESKRLKLDIEQGDMINFLRYLMESFHSFAESKKIRLHFMNDLKVKEFYMDYDAIRLMHVISNLISNAIKFTPEGGDVYLTVDGRAADGRRENGRRDSASIARYSLLLIKVKDSGIGIPKDRLPFVFDRFYQVDDSATRKGEGTGIGLTLAKELVKLMNGQIDVQSELGIGSEFTVALPVIRQKPIQAKTPEFLSKYIETAPSKRKVPKTKKEAGKPLMLIVEDNADLVKYLINSFNPAYNLEVAYNGQQGIDKAISLIPDIIITDVMMPEKNGFELCFFLKRHKLTSHIPIIMLTAKVDVDARLTGFRRGADAYLEKPFLQEELKTRIQTLLEQRKKLQAYYLSKAGLFEETQLELPGQEEAKLENAFLTSVNQIIEAHLNDEHFTVEQLCRELFIDPSNLYRKLKALTGINPNQYIRTFRLAKAKTLLVTTNLSIALIAAECGFAYQNYFSRIFKKETGLTPTEYRAERSL